MKTRFFYDSKAQYAVELVDRLLVAEENDNTSYYNLIYHVAQDRDPEMVALVQSQLTKQMNSENQESVETILWDIGRERQRIETHRFLNTPACICTIF